MKLLFAVGCGGFLGAIARYLLGGWLQSFAISGTTRTAAFPWGTLAVNVLGCLVIGLFAGQITRVPETWRLFLVTGLLGGLTTFSTFGIDSVQLARGEMPLLGLANVAAHLVLGLGAVALGMFLTRPS